MKRTVLSAAAAICALLCSCEKPIDGHDVADFRILNYSDTDIAVVLNGSAVPVEKNTTETYVSAPMNSSVEVETVENHLTCAVRYAVFHNGQFYNYIEIKNLPSYNYSAGNLSCRDIEIVFGEAEDDRLIIPAKESVQFTSYVRKERITAAFPDSDSGIDAKAYVRIEYTPLKDAER